MQDKDITEYSGIQELLKLEIMNNYNRSIVKDSLFLKNKINKIIDFGAGIGTLSLIFREKYKKEPFCIEIDNVNINYLKKRKFKTFQNIDDISFKADLIFSSNVLEHIKDDYLTIVNLKKHLDDNGILFLYLPAKKILWTKLDKDVGHYRRYEISRIKNLCKDAGLKIIKLKYADSLGFFTTILWKIINRFKNQTLPSKSSLEIYDKYIFPISRLLDKMGFKYLIGKNIILIAQKKL
tara:strand:- start:294 stop:1004 length:711 start_codon:yes stop_codon:yes gene_type:complete